MWATWRCALQDHSDTALHQALFNGHVACVQLLLEWGAQPDLAKEVSGKWLPAYCPLTICVGLLAGRRHSSEPCVFHELPSVCAATVAPV